MLPPVADKTTSCPAQMVVGDAVTVIIGLGFTFTVHVAVAVQPFPSVAVTVYVCVEVGLAAVLAQVAHDNPEGGDHEYI